ncbi:hypothetical protein [Pseudomonas amygdali]|uniref:hypothetical protein n=1 Tax=Pseudomonas amygdali TaxID=47877 RepID=UPI003966DEBA
MCRIKQLLILCLIGFNVRKHIMVVNKALFSVVALACTLGLSGCMTAQKMPDGSTKIRISDDAANSLASMMPTGIMPMITGNSANGAGSGAGGGMDLNPTLSQLGTGEWMYLNGRYDYECMSALLYSAKSGSPIDADTNETCRDRYFLRQQQLKRAGKSYDRGAPAYDPANPPTAYWKSVSGQTISQLAAMNQFSTRFEGLPRFDKAGRISVKVGFLGAAKGQDVRLVTVPDRTPVVMDDAAFESGMRSRSAQMNTDIGEMSACTAVLNVANAVDKGRRPARIPSSEYSRYEVQFSVATLGCKNSIHEFKSASGTTASR